MDQPDPSHEHLQRMVEALVRLLPTLECPECCDQGHRYQYIELSAAFYRDEWEWAHFSGALLRYRPKAAP